MDNLPTIDLVKALLVIVAGAIGTFLLLPHRHGQIKPKLAHRIGAVFVAVAILSFAFLWKAPSEILTGVFFYVFGVTAIASAIITITTKNPVYCALWFASVILSTCGLFLLAGAQFLAAGTVIVYAGAIVVTFLFVIMLAQIEKIAPYDRTAGSPARATFTAYLLLWSLLYALLTIQNSAKTSHPIDLERRLVHGSNLGTYYKLRDDVGRGLIVKMANTPTSQLPDTNGGPALGQHVAGLGGTLFTDHLISVELAGSLLFIALVAAVAIASPKVAVRPSNAPVDPSTLM